MVLQIVDQLRVFSVFSGEDLLQLEDWSVDFHSSVLLEDVRNGIDDLPPYGHLIRIVIPGSFRWLYLKLDLILRRLSLVLLPLNLLIFLIGLLIDQRERVFILEQERYFFLAPPGEWVDLGCLLFGHAYQQIINRS